MTYITIECRNCSALSIININNECVLEINLINYIVSDIALDFRHSSLFYSKCSSKLLSESTRTKYILLILKLSLPSSIVKISISFLLYQVFVDFLLSIGSNSRPLNWPKCSYIIPNFINFDEDFIQKLIGYHTRLLPAGFACVILPSYIYFYWDKK